MIDAHRPGRLAALACMLEATARKPGNVHRFRDFADTHYLDFLASALAIGPPLDQARGSRVGVVILDAVEQTRALVNTNTNLGMILLLAPLAAVEAEEGWAVGLERVLSGTDVDDARRVYRAIRLARPGGLGKSESQDVGEEPTVSLREAMRMASERDAIARQYALGYPDVLDIVVPALSRNLGSGRSLETAIIGAFLATLSGRPDTLIGRKRGVVEAAEASGYAREVLEAGWPEEEKGRERFEAFDGWLREDGHARNPGATADLVAAGLFVALRDGTIRLPLDRGSGLEIPFAF